MKKIYLSLLSFASLSLVSVAFAEEISIDTQKHTSTQFSPEQVGDIRKIMTEHLVQNPEIVMTAVQAGMAQKQKEEVEKIEKAVVDNNDKIFKNEATPIAGNPKGTDSLVIFMDPYCGYCKKFHGELNSILNENKNVKIIFVDVPIMGPGSVLAIKAMLAAKEQGKYDQLQKAIFSADKHLSKKQIFKIASSLGIDTKKLEEDIKSKAIQAQIDQNSELAKTLGINGTPTLIIGEKTVVPGFMSAEEVSKKLKEVVPAVETKPLSEKAS